jgi:glycosyltransferase involved in cell wall biosynthesis
LRILHISSARALGGGERHLADLARGLVSRGHDVFVALARESPLCAELAGVLPVENIFTLPLRNALDAASAHRLARFVRERRIEIVHAHVARDYTLAAFAAWRSPAARLVVTRHVLFPLSRLHRLTLGRAARVIAVSEAVARALRAQRLVAADKISVIHNGIDFARLDAAAGDTGEMRRSLMSGDVSFVVGTVGELSRVKGQEDLVRAAATVNRALAGRVGFVLVGEDASRAGETRARLESLIAELDLSERIRLLGRRADVARILHALDLFVSASHTEAFGIAIVEALASGVPVVATETEGAREIIGAGAGGRLVPVGDAEALAASIVALLGDASERARLSDDGRASARERFSLTRMIDATERVYLAARSSV